MQDEEEEDAHSRDCTRLMVGDLQRISPRVSLFSHRHQRHQHDPFRQGDRGHEVIKVEFCMDVVLRKTCGR